MLCVDVTQDGKKCPPAMALGLVMSLKNNWEKEIVSA